MTDLPNRFASVAGLLVMIGTAWLCSSDRRAMPWRTVAWGLGLQLALAVLLLKTAVGGVFFEAMRLVTAALSRYVDAGTEFVFGDLVPGEFSFAIEVLPIIIFMGSLLAVLYHLGIMQRVVDGLAWALSRTMGISGAESLAAIGNIFVGLTESAMIVRPYLERMTRSELFSLMTVGMSTVAGSVMLAYVKILGSSDYAGHLATASLLSAPAGILIAKVMVPETAVPATAASTHAADEHLAVNVFDAAAEGATAGLRLAAYIGAMLIAFVALIAMVNDGLGTLGLWAGIEHLTLEHILGALLAPMAWLLGIPWVDAAQIGSLLGVKTVLNEFLAYLDLSELIRSGAIQPRSAMIASYALCGFANFGSLAILLGGIGGIAPSRRPEVAELGLRSILSGTLATFMTACIAGILL
ncbi:MAG: NupC/NupG family nucleoside CNT transporter [Myxococcota bacterium]